MKTCLSFDSGLDVKNFLRSGVDDEELSKKFVRQFIASRVNTFSTARQAKKFVDAAIITMSDRGFHGLRDEDTSGDKCEELLTAAGYKIVTTGGRGHSQAVDECLSFVLPELQHGTEILRGEVDK